jgi:hypothetical protein
MKPAFGNIGHLLISNILAPVSGPLTKAISIRPTRCTRAAPHPDPAGGVPVMNIAKRAVQIAKIGMAARKLRKSSSEADKQLARQALANLFADARGGAMKIGQLMAGQDDDNPFADLATGIEPLDFAEIEPVVEAGLGRPLNDVFSEFYQSEVAASLGQVHRASLIDGQEVAVKVQYPGIAKAVAAELTLAGLTPGVGPVKKWGFDLDGYKTALKENMDRELDYRNEARRQTRFREQVRVSGLIVPKVHQDLTSKQVLVQDWHSGVRLAEVADWSVKDRTAVGRILLSTLFKSLFDAGEIHGDPHPGNAYYSKTATGDPAVVLMDFGCTAPVRDVQRMSLLKLIFSLRDGAPDCSLQGFSGMGFDARKLAAISESMPHLSRILLEPFLVNRAFTISEWGLKDRFEALMGENRWWFRAAGAPVDILMLRAFQGVAQQLDQLDAALDWHRVLIDTVAPETIAKARSYTLPSLPPDIAVGVAALSNDEPAAESLRVEVHDGDKQIVSITMPAAAALNLKDLVPEDVMELIQKSGDIDVDAILTRLMTRGLQPQEILDFEKPPKRYRIWLA